MRPSTSALAELDRLRLRWEWGEDNTAGFRCEICGCEFRVRKLDASFRWRDTTCPCCGNGWVRLGDVAHDIVARLGLDLLDKGGDGINEAGRESATNANPALTATRTEGGSADDG